VLLGEHRRALTEPVASTPEEEEGRPMAQQQPLQLILMRELADVLGTPMFVVDGAGGLVFYNEPAEKLLGRRFEETGPMPAEEWSTVFGPLSDEGEPMPPTDLPLVVALRDGQAAHETFSIRGLDGTVRRVATTAIPLIDSHGALLGAAALFWEAES
jgi:PAS domain-containing protein